MKSEVEVKAEIARIEKDYVHVLYGSVSTIQVNAPRALMQMDAESKLTALSWVLGQKYKSKLKGTNR